MSWFRRAPRVEDEIERLEERKRTLARVTQEWLTLVREMEASGETEEEQYAHYFRAYLEAKEQEKRVDLELFNYRQGLVG